VSLEEAQKMIMTARVMLGWVDPDDLVKDTEEEDGELSEEQEA
jgi:N utilization substance protein A